MGVRVNAAEVRRTVRTVTSYDDHGSEYPVLYGRLECVAQSVVDGHASVAKLAQALAHGEAVERAVEAHRKRHRAEVDELGARVTGALLVENRTYCPLVAGVEVARG